MRNSSDQFASRVRLGLLATVVLIFAAASCLALLRPSASNPAFAQNNSQQLAGGVTASGSPFSGMTRNGVPSKQFTLRDQDGKLVSLSDYRGRTTIVTFLYSTCRDTCPQISRLLAATVDRFKKAPPIVIVSVDPKGDSPKAARKFLNRIGLAGRARYLLGTKQQLAPVWKTYAIQPQGPKYEHSAYVLVLDSKGRQQVSWPAGELTVDGLAHDLEVVSRSS